ncbi:14061_t:CDS:2 [Gigaspora margarita]|uniref:14061_t:CDS:1 n=1 Tax=Gigaspora margarita TaxID=4874 RepID=A0ABN7W2Y1_GIGMA|nr:14061_t:CDS:2 [Gigaspora margarita]
MALNDAKQVANNKNGECLSETYINNCAHSRPLTLEEAKQIAHSRNGLELDIPYYPYGFAIEVQGEQHEKYNEFLHKGDPNNFIKQKERDQLKKELCEENYPYIVIPEHLRELGLI